MIACGARINLLLRRADVLAQRLGRCRQTGIGCVQLLGSSAFFLSAAVSFCSVAGEMALQAVAPYQRAQPDHHCHHHRRQ